MIFFILSMSILALFIYALMRTAKRNDEQEVGYEDDE